MYDAWVPLHHTPHIPKCRILECWNLTIRIHLILLLRQNKDPGGEGTP